MGDTTRIFWTDHTFMEIRKLMRIMIDLEHQAKQAERYDNTRRADELWAQRLNVQLSRSTLMRELWARQRPWRTKASVKYG